MSNPWRCEETDFPHGNNYDVVGRMPPEAVEWWGDFGDALDAARLVMDYYQPLTETRWWWR